MSQATQVFSAPPTWLVVALEEHLPYSLPLLRRLQFTSYPKGRTPSSHVVFVGGSDDAAQTATKIDAFAAAYVDFSRGLETQMWMYSTLEDGQADDATLLLCEDQIVTLVAEVGRISSQFTEQRAYPNSVLIGTLNAVVRSAMEKRGICVRARSALGYEKWLVKVDDLPAEDVLPDGMTWAAVTAADCVLVLSRTAIQRQVYEPVQPSSRMPLMTV